ncbi:MAG TPA: esterase-like activity of phytase family protein [Gammaproteobacteria bacterium]|nr:esterase-like activity of phytase family protein [Gammaproteobacteria bacterium]
MTKSICFMRLLSCAVALFVPLLLEAAQPSMSVEVLDTLILEEPLVDDLKIIELSGLTYDQKNQRLLAVSDKGRLFHFKIDVTGDKIVSLKPETGYELVDGQGQSMRKQHVFNAEGIALDQDGTLAIVSEVGPRISRFSFTGEWLEDLTVSAELRDPAKQRSEKDGLESLAWHPTFGWLTAPEEPLAAMKRTTHTIYATSGRTFTYDTAEIGSTSIKAIESLPDGRLMILERDVAVDHSLITWLRVLDPTRCVDDQLCVTQAVQVEVPGIVDADFEGLAYLSDGLFMIVSDDKINKNHRSVFALLRVTPPSAE